MAPLVVKGKVLVGNSGGEFGVRGWLTALDADTGKIAWRAYHTGPDKDVLIGPNFKPFYASDRGKDLGVSRPGRGSSGRSAAAACGAGSPTIPELDLIYYGTANPGLESRHAARRQQVDVHAVRAASRHRRSHLGVSDVARTTMHDYDGVNENMLLDLHDQRADCARCWCIPIATVTCT